LEFSGANTRDRGLVADERLLAGLVDKMPSRRGRAALEHAALQLRVDDTSSNKALQLTKRSHAVRRPASRATVIESRFAA
jgi:hypothetical protein